MTQIGITTNSLWEHLVRVGILYVASFKVFHVMLHFVAKLMMLLFVLNCCQYRQHFQKVRLPCSPATTVIHYVCSFYCLLRIVSQLVIEMDIISLKAAEDLG